MDLIFLLSAAIFTLLAIVAATSLLGASSSSSAPCAKVQPRVELRNGPGSGSEQPEPKQNGHAAEEKAERKALDDWCDVSGSAHDHWDVVKSVQSEEAQPHLRPQDLAVQTDHSSSASTSVEAEGAAESPGTNDDLESDEGSALRYVPGKARSHHLEMMLSTEELEEEQRVQREQLAAIFQLLKDNKATFGDVSEGDMEEQLRLYSI